MTDTINLLQDIIKKAKAKGADGADAVHVDGTSLSLTYRLGEVEQLERSEGGELGLRVLVGKRQAIVSSSDMSTQSIDEMVERAVAMAKVVPEDEFAGLAEPEQLITGAIPELYMFDPIEPGAKEMEEMARAAEESGLAVKGVTNSEGASVGFSKTSIAVAASNGLAHSYARSGFSLSVSLLAGSGSEMERDWDYSGAVWLEDLRGPVDVGKTAGENAVKRLGSKKVSSGVMDVVFDARIARSLIGHLSGAINGQSIARGTSFLKNAMGKNIFSNNINIVDDPLRKRGLRSAPFDDEGLATKKMNVIENGVLKSWFLDLRSARQLGLHSNAHASRGVSSPPHPSSSNLYLAPGDKTPEQLISEIKQGILITELIGMGVNQVTGDYSRGASGFWIENGEIQFPVSELTVAGNLKDIFLGIEPA
ncbi:MAG: metallopeptidase TldD-related protein, partial [Rhodospirillaceae bacterium]|nr:metallopeptidase TldD-related protein [Rhodospirillaceae bacterium]